MLVPREAQKLPSGKTLLLPVSAVLVAGYSESPQLRGRPASTEISE